MGNIVISSKSSGLELNEFIAFTFFLLILNNYSNQIIVQWLF